MRISPNTHPVIRIRNTLLTAASLFAIWLLLCLTSCAMDPATEMRQTPMAATPNLRETPARFAPTGLIPLAEPLAPMRANSGLWT